MAKYRFKTKEEFIRDKQWNPLEQVYPYGWADSMLEYLGTDVPEKYNDRCDLDENINMHGWSFMGTNYVLKSTNPIKEFKIHPTFEIKM